MKLEYTDIDGLSRTLEGVEVTEDKAGRYWIWSEQLKHNIAYKEATLDDALKSAIASLLFTVHLRDERIKALQRIADEVDAFIEQVRPTDKED
jgi:hypothetical protein